MPAKEKKASHRAAGGEASVISPDYLGDTAQRLPMSDDPTRKLLVKPQQSSRIGHQQPFFGN